MRHGNRAENAAWFRARCWASVGPDFLSFSPFSLSLLLLRNEGFSTVYWWPRMHSSRRRTDTSNFGRNRRFFVSRALRAHDSWVIPMARVWENTQIFHQKSDFLKFSRNFAAEVVCSSGTSLRGFYELCGIKNQ